jgi:chemotaxis protein methyltransferase CheR
MSQGQVGNPLDDLLRWLGARTGLLQTPERRFGTEAAVRRAMGRAGVDDPDRYRSLVEADEGALDDLIGELTVGETYFFREPDQFDLLRRRVLPELLSLRDPDAPLRIWSAGCATGEEAYSVAILLAEMGLAGRARVLATDLSRPSLAKAREGVYGAWSLRGDGAALARPYLHRRGARYVVDPAIRRLVTFEFLNLAADAYPSFATGTWGMDVILCRNVLIYFDPATIRTTARRLCEALAPGGWLLTASADPPLADVAPFETELTGQGLFYRHRPVAAEGASGLVDRGVEDSPPSIRRFSGVAPVESAPPAAPPVPDASALLAEAREGLARGDYAGVAERTGPGVADEAVAAVHVRALASRDVEAAERACAAATARHPLSGELHCLRALLLLDLGRVAEAAREARRAVYLDRTLAVAHFTLGSILRRRGDRTGAWRAYRNARDLCAARPPDEAVPLGEGEVAARLASAAAAQAALLEVPGRVGR